MKQLKDKEWSPLLPGVKIYFSRAIRNFKHIPSGLFRRGSIEEYRVDEAGT